MAAHPLLPLAVLALAAPALAGCVGSAAAGTAEAGRAPADEAARRWDPQAQLAGIFGLEGAFGSFGAAMMGSFAWAGDRDDGAYWSRPASDARVGDGACEFWVFGYVAPGKELAHLVIVDREGKVLRERDVRTDDRTTVGEWKVNSDEALRIAKEANQGLREGLASQRWGVVEMLHREAGDERATWRVMGGGGDGSGGGGGFVELDAVTGEVLRSTGGFGRGP